MKWFLLRKEEICGPYKTAHILENCDDQTLIWGPGMSEWSNKSAWQRFLNRPKEVKPIITKTAGNTISDSSEKTVEEVAELALHQLNDKWFFAYDRERFGPLNQNHLIQKISSLEHVEKVLLWKKGEPTWRPIFEFPKILKRLNEKLDNKKAA